MTSKIGNYTVQGELGRGGMSTVYRATNAQGEAVALKTMLPRWADDPSGRARFAREANLRLTHPNIVSIVDAGESNNTPYFAMQLVEGESLDSILRRAGKLDLSQLLPVLRDVASGLDYAHSRGIIHRDLKPSNILVRAKDNRAFLTDFGVAKDVDATQLTSVTSQRIGTPQYMSPEQVRGDRSITGATDVYALGTLVYRALSGHVPFDAESDLAIARMHLQDAPPDMRRWNPGVPPAVASVVMRALSKDPARRPKTATEFVNALAAAQSGRIKMPVAAGGSSKNLIVGVVAAAATLAVGFVVLMLATQSGSGGRAATATSANPVAGVTSAARNPTATLVAFAQATDIPTAQPPAPTSIPVLPADTAAPPTFTPLPAPTATPACKQANPYNVSASALQNLGCGGVEQKGRSVVYQDFAGGFMLVFSKPGNVWDNKPGAIIYAFSDGGRAWRVVDQFNETSSNSDSWYSCQATPGQRPENSGIPWRGFGLAWCNNSAIRNALGKVASGSGEVKDTADYAEYENGSRVVKFRNRVYVITITSGGAGSWQ